MWRNSIHSFIFSDWSHRHFTLRHTTVTLRTLRGRALRCPFSAPPNASLSTPARPKRFWRENDVARREDGRGPTVFRPGGAGRRPPEGGGGDQGGATDPRSGVGRCRMPTPLTPSGPTPQRPLSGDVHAGASPGTSGPTSYPSTSTPASCRTARPAHTRSPRRRRDRTDRRLRERVPPGRTDPPQRPSAARSAAQDRPYDGTSGRNGTLRRNPEPPCPTR